MSARVSVVIPTYNHRVLVREAIQSPLQQTPTYDESSSWTTVRPMARRSQSRHMSETFELSRARIRACQLPGTPGYAQQVENLGLAPVRDQRVRAALRLILSHSPVVSFPCVPHEQAIDLGQLIQGSRKSYWLHGLCGTSGC